MLEGRKTGKTVREKRVVEGVTVVLKSGRKISARMQSRTEASGKGTKTTRGGEKSVEWDYVQPSDTNLHGEVPEEHLGNRAHKRERWWINNRDSCAR